MTKKANLVPVEDSTVNSNLERLNNQFNNTLSRDGSTPNSMGADLDMDSNDILNVKSLSTEDITVAGSPLALREAVEDANQSALDSEGFANQAETWAKQVKPFDFISDLASDTGLVDGVTYRVNKGYNNQVEFFVYDAGSTLTADGALVVTATGMGVGQFVSTRTEYANWDEAKNDVRTFPNGTTATIKNASGFLTARPTNGSWGVANAGGQNFDAWSLIGDTRLWGSVGDNVVNDSPAIQRAINAVPAWTNVALAAGGSQPVGGGLVTIPQTATGYNIADTLNIPTKIIINGPARLNGATGQPIMTFTYTGSTSHSGVQIYGLDFVGGSIGLDTGNQIVPMPVSVKGCMFVNQEVAGMKVGAYGFNITVRDNLFTGSAGYGFWSVGQAADSLLLDHNTFIYNYDYDIVIEMNNVFRVTNNAFVGNQKSPEADAANIFIKTFTSSSAGGHSVIKTNKFGQEGRTGGHCIVFDGTGGVLQNVTVEDNLFHFLSQTTTNYAIKVGAKSVAGLTVRNNSLIQCSVIDASGMASPFSTGNKIARNSKSTNEAWTSQLLKGNWDVVEEQEPATFDKYNLIKFSRFINDATFAYANVTSGFSSVVDENGHAGNASTFLATTSGALVRIVSLKTNNQQKFYTFSMWLKLDVEDDVKFSFRRSGQFAVNQFVTVGTAWQRVCFTFYQTYFAAANPYVGDITFPNGRTLTTGNVCLVPGRDAGDLRRRDVTIEYGGGSVKSPASPLSGIYWPAGTHVDNSAPVVASPTGWVSTTAGTAPTWVAKANL